MTTAPSRLPPQNVDAEVAVLGAMIVEPAVIPVANSVLTPRDFYRASHEKICAVIFDLWAGGKPVDLITVSEALRSREELHTVGGVGYLATLNDLALPSPFHVQQHAEFVKEASCKRRALEALRIAEEEIYGSGSDVFSIIGRLNTSLASVGDGRGSGLIPMPDAVFGAMKKIEMAMTKGDRVTGIPTGLASLDGRFGGIQRGELWTLAGRPSLGKSALAAKIAEGAAKAGFGVCFITAEMPHTQVVQRMLSSATGLENRDLRRGRVSDIGLPRLVMASAKIKNLPIWFLDNDPSWDRAKAKIAMWKLKHPEAALVVIDYVGLLSAPVPRGERYLEVGRISSEAKQLAKDSQMGVLLVSQLNRAVENRVDKKPRLSDLRESGNLEQDSDVVALLFADEGGPVEQVELDIAKNRDGETGVIPLWFRKETLTFSDRDT